MKVWGCKCWVHVPKEQNDDKLDSQAQEGIFIGYTEGFWQYSVFLPANCQIVKVTNPRFVENEKGNPGRDQNEILEQ